MDLYDVARDGGGDHWLSQIAAPIRLVGISSDWLFAPPRSTRPSDQLAWLGRDVDYAEIDSPNGHDAFLKDWDQLNPIIDSFVQRARSRPRTGTSTVPATAAHRDHQTGPGNHKGPRSFPGITYARKDQFVSEATAEATRF